MTRHVAYMREKKYAWRALVEKKFEGSRPL